MFGETRVTNFNALARQPNLPLAATANKAELYLIICYIKQTKKYMLARQKCATSRYLVMRLNNFAINDLTFIRTKNS